jgi:ADP-heptose:LPS heptosyltransferase
MHKDCVKASKKIYHILSDENLMRSEIKKILIIRPGRIGDVLLTTPVIRSLRKKFPDARIDFLVTKASFQILENNNYIDNVLIFDKTKTLYWTKKIRREKYDLILDYFGNSRSISIILFSGAKIKVGYKGHGREFVYNVSIKRRSDKESYTVNDLYKYLNVLNAKTDGYKLDFFIDDRSKQYIENYIANNLSNKDFIVISPTSRRQARVWKEEYFAEVITHIKDNYKFEIILVWGGENELKVVNRINKIARGGAHIAPKTDLKQLGALIARSKLMITNNNGPMHIAVSQGIPTITICGPTNPINWKAPEKIHRTVYADIDCIGCGKKECSVHRCMIELKPERIIEEFKNLLKMRR